MNSQSAEATSILMLKLTAALDAQLASIQPVCATEEFRQFRRRFAEAMAPLMSIANYIYEQHPGLKPTRMGGNYHLPNSVIEQSVAQLVSGA